VSWVEKRGPKTWKAVVRVDGRKYSKSFETSKAAHSWIASKVHERDLGIFAPRTSQTFEEWVTTYWSNAEKRPKTVERDKGALKKWWTPALGSLRLVAIQPADVRRVVKQMTEAGLSPKTIRTYYGVLRAVMNAAIEQDHLMRTPLRGIKLPQDNRIKEIRFLSVEELGRLADAIKPEYRVTVFLAGVVGLRFGEVAGLRPKDVDLDAGTVSVVQSLSDINGKLSVGLPKTSAGRRTINVPASVVAELRTHAETHPGSTHFVERLDGQPLTRRTFMRWTFAPAANAADIEGMTFHHLRHTAVGFLIEVGAHPRVIQQRAGHSSFRVTMDVYGHVLDSADQAVTDALEDLFA